MNNVNDSQFTFKPVTHEDVLLKLKSINCAKSTGFELIAPTAVKLSANECCMPITSVVNNVFKINTFPVAMKQAEISPISKKKDYMLKE